MEEELVSLEEDLKQDKLVKDEHKVLPDGEENVLLELHRVTRFNKQSIQHEVKNRLEENKTFEDIKKKFENGKLFKKVFDTKMKELLDVVTPKIKADVEAQLNELMLKFEAKKRDNDYFLAIWKGKI